MEIFRWVRAGLWVIVAMASMAQAAVTLPCVWQSHMVLQRERPIPVWGWAAPGERVTVTLDRRAASTKADASGAWTVTLPKMSAGGPFTLTVAGTNTVTLDDVLVGEVWLCSGQSNMEMGVKAALHGETEVAAAKYPHIQRRNSPKW